jgi:hypothetical protein
MKWKTIFLGLVFLSFRTVSTISANIENKEKYESGLYFCSYEAEKDNRTSLNLPLDNSLNLKDGFTMSFDLQLREDKYNYGYIFRIIANDTLSIDFLSVSAYPNNGFFVLTAGNKSLIRIDVNEIENITTYDWIKVSFTLNSQTNQLQLIINEKKKETEYPATGLKFFNVFFGANSHPIFFTTDVNAMSIRNIRLYNNNGKNIRFGNWENMVLMWFMILV